MVATTTSTIDKPHYPTIEWKLPDKFKGSDGKPYSILTDAQRNAAFKEFQDLANKALNPAPTPKDTQFTVDGKFDVKRYKEVRAAYDSNPLLEPINDIKKRYVDGEVYADDMQQLANGFMYGVDNAAADPKQKEKQAGIWQHLKNWNFPEAIKAAVMMIPFVSDLMLTGGKWIMSKFEGKAVTWEDAAFKVKLERAFSGAFANVGATVGGAAVSQQGTENFVDNNFANLKSGNFVPTLYIEPPKPTPPPPAPTLEKLDTSFDAQVLDYLKKSEDKGEKMQKIQSAISSGQIVLKDGEFFGTIGAILDLDQMPEKIAQQLPNASKKDGTSWIFDESKLPVKSSASHAK